MNLLPLDDADHLRRQQFAEAARVARELRVTPETTLDDLRLTVRSHNRLIQLGVKTVDDILAEKMTPAALDHLSLKEFVGVMTEVRDRLVAGGINEAQLPVWVTDSESN